MHWAAEFSHLSTLKLLCENFDRWTDADKVRPLSIATIHVV